MFSCAQFPRHPQVRQLEESLRESLAKSRLTVNVHSVAAVLDYKAHYASVTDPHLAVRLTPTHDYVPHGLRRCICNVVSYCTARIA